jgi:hypothetical protein
VTDFLRRAPLFEVSSSALEDDGNSQRAWVGLPSDLRPLPLINNLVNIHKYNHDCFLKGLSSEIFLAEVVTFDRYFLKGEALRFSADFYQSSLMKDALYVFAPHRRSLGN